MNLLHVEMAWFEVHRPILAAAHPGQFVLVRGKRFCGFFATRQEALSAGYDSFGNTPFLVRECSPVTAPIVTL